MASRWSVLGPLVVVDVALFRPLHCRPLRTLWRPVYLQGAHGDSSRGPTERKGAGRGLSICHRKQEGRIEHFWALVLFVVGAIKTSETFEKT